MPADPTILIVDDRAANRAYLRAVLGARGYNIIEAEDGADALELTCAHRPDLVMADILMPRMDGYEFVQHVRSIPTVSRTPIILLTAHYMESDVHTLADSIGVERVIIKPFEPQVILGAVETCLSTETTRSSVQRTDVKQTHGSTRERPAVVPRSSDILLPSTHIFDTSSRTFEHQHRRLLTDTLARKASQLELANDRLRGLINLGRRLATEWDARRLLSIFGSAAGELLSASYVVVAVADFDEGQDGQGQKSDQTVDQQCSLGDPASPHRASAAQTDPPVRIEHVIANGREPEVIGRISSSRLVAHLLRISAGSKEPILLTDVSGAIRRGELPRSLTRLEPGIAIAPIITATRRYGFVLFGGLRLEDEENGSVGSLAQSMGAVLGVAYENTLRYQEIERHAARLHAEIADRRAAEERVLRLNAELEERVADRTAELEKSHQRLRQSERMASLGTLCAGLGHDLANLLLPIRVRLDTLEEQAATSNSQITHPVDAGRNDSSFTEHLSAIRQCVQYLGDLASGLRLLSLDPDRDESSSPSTDLRSWWAHVEPLMRSALPANIELDAELPSDLPDIAITEHRLTQAIFNLIQNASSAIQSQHGDAATKGRVAITARLEPSPSTTDLRADDDNAGAQRVVLTVTDNGPGMSEEVKRRAVEPFFTTKTRALSTGLGLSLVHGIVTSANGQIDIQSMLEQGTTVHVALPGARSTSRSPTPSSDRPHAVVSIRHDRLRTCSTSMLRLLGYEVRELTADDAARAIEQDEVLNRSGVIWISEVETTPIQCRQAFLNGSEQRRLALLGDLDPAHTNNGCIHLGSQPSIGRLRAQINRHFSRRRRDASLIDDLTTVVSGSPSHESPRPVAKSGCEKR